MKRLVVILFILMALAAKSQQIPVVDHYFTNPYLINPAKAGTGDLSNVFLMTRQQWTDIQGAPKLTTLSVDGSFDMERVGLGLMLSNDVDNIFKRTAVYGTYSYHFQINQNQKISLGLNLGLMNVHIAFDELQSDGANDPLVFSQNGLKTKLDAAAGVNYQFKDLEVGVVGYQLMNSKYNYQDQTNNTDLNYQLIQHFLVLANYRYTAIPEKLTITPTIIARTTLGLPVQFDAGVYFSHKNMLWSHIGYRQNSCIYINVGGKIYNNLTISGAYEYNLGNIAKFSGPSYEILLGYSFGKQTAVQQDRSYTEKRAKESIDRNAQLQSENLDKIIYENKVLKDKIEQNEEEITALKEEVGRLKKNTVFSEEDIQELESFKDQYELTPEDISILKKDEPEDSEITEIHHNNKYNVIVGAYKTIKNAKLGQQILMREFNLKTFILKNPNSSFFFIATKEFEHIEGVSEEHKRLKKLGVEEVVNGDIWVYKDNKED